MVQKLQKKFGDIYHFDNVMISGTHTHGTPGGFMMHVLYDISTCGFVPETYNALVQGIYRVNIELSLSSQEVKTNEIFFRWFYSSRALK